MEPVGTGRQLTAKDLTQEWQMAVFRNSASQAEADRHIEDLVERFLNEDPVASYHLDVYRRYDSILRLTSDHEVYSQGVKETRSCGEIATKVHLLQCGHLVFTEKESICLSNCESASNNHEQYFCLLCTRMDLRLSKCDVPDRWYDLLSLKAAYPGKETRKAAQPGIIDTQPAYLDPYGYIILPCIHYTIAMVQAFEKRKETEVKALIRTVCANPLAIELLELFLQHHDQLNHADINYLAFLAVTPLFSKRPTLADEAALLQSLGATARPNADDIHAYLHDGSRIKGGGAERVLATIIKAIPDRARVSMFRMHLQRQPMQIWEDVVASGKFDAYTLWTDRARIMACCVKITLGEHHSVPSYKAILSMIGQELVDWRDELIVETVEKIVAEKSYGDARKPVQHRIQLPKEKFD